MQDRLDSWKEIAAYLKRGPRTVQRWEREEGLPVRRLQHEKLGSVYAFKSELDAWWARRGADLSGPETESAQPAPAVAVLPFADLSKEQDQAYLCEGIADEIICQLSRLPGLKVASRTSSFRFPKAASDTREIGKRLGVTALLEGSVRSAAGRLRVAVRLVNPENGFQLWAERYDRESRDIFDIQDEIAGSVAGALELKLVPGEGLAGRKRAADLRAYDFYLRGRSYYYQYSPKAVACAIQMFIRAMETDPNYPRAYAGLADCWSYIYLYSNRTEVVRQQAAWASRKAVEMDPDSAPAQASLGLSLSLEGKNDEAAQAFEKAIELDPGLFEAYYFYARHAFALGRFEQAARLYEEAMRVHPEDYQAPLLVAQVYDDLKRPRDAAASRRHGVELAENRARVAPDDARALYMAANGLVALGERERGRQAAERARAIQPDDPMLLYNVGCIFAMLNLTGEALDCLEKAAASGLTQRGWYEHDSNLDSLRSHPRFQSLLQSLP